MNDSRYHSCFLEFLAPLVLVLFPLIVVIILILTNTPGG